MDLTPVWARLRDLGDGAPTFGARREVMKALTGDIRSVCGEAALTLAAWGDRASVRALRGLLLRGFGSEPFAWAILDGARAALLRCVTERDAEWVFDLFYGPLSLMQAGKLLPVIARLPLTTQREWIHPESISPSVARRKRAVLALAAIYLPEEQRILQRLRLDDDRGVRHLAGEVCRPLAGKNRRDEEDPLPRAIVPLIPRALIIKPLVPGPVLLQEFESSPSRLQVLGVFVQRRGELVQRWLVTDRGPELLPLNAWDGLFEEDRRGNRSYHGPVGFWLSPRGDRLYLEGWLGSLGRDPSFRVQREGGMVELEEEEET